MMWTQRPSDGYCMGMSKLLVGVIAVVLLAPVPTAHAQVVSEVMYDLEGSDTSREWIEIFNNTGSAIDLTTFKLFEANSNHGVVYVQGPSTLDSGGYAVIAENAGKFLADWPGYAGALFDSSFSLSNTGETISIRTADLVDTDSASYDVASGAAGDGTSLQRSSVGGAFSAAAPTPGSGGLVVSGGTPTASGDSSTGTQSSQQLVVTPATVPVEPQLYASAGKDRTVLVGADVVFSGKAFSKDGTPLEGNGIRYVWNFGDGVTSDQQTVAHHFSYPGVYVVVLDVASGKNDAASRITVTAVDPQLQVERRPDGSVVITNGANHEIDLSLWHLRREGIFFTIPDHTVVLARRQLILRPDALRLPPGEVVLLYPNGMVVPVGGSVQQEQNNTPALGPASLLQQVSTEQPTVAETPREEEMTDSRELSGVSTSTSEANLAAVAAVSGGTLWFIGITAILLIGGGGVALLFRKKNPLDGWEIQEGDEHPDD